MAEKTKTTAVGAAAFSKQELIESAVELGTTPEILAGALVSVNKEKITIDEAKKAVDAYCTRVVKN